MTFVSTTDLKVDKMKINVMSFHVMFNSREKRLLSNNKLYSVLKVTMPSKNHFVYDSRRYIQ